MNNKKIKALTVAVAVLAAALIFETAYLLGNRQRRGEREYGRMMHSAVVPGHVPGEDYFRVFNERRGRDPFFEMEKMRQRMQDIFDGSFSGGVNNRIDLRVNSVFEPNISISRKGDIYIVKADLPGLDKKDIKVEIRGRELAISGERKDEAKKQEKGYYRQELSYGSFYRSILLPEDAKTDKIASEYKNGVLTIVIPGAPPDKKPAEEPVKVVVQ